MFLALPTRGTPRFAACVLATTVALGLAGGHEPAATQEREPIGVLVTSARFDDPAKQRAVSDSSIDLMEALDHHTIDSLTAVFRLEDADMFVQVIDRYRLRVTEGDQATGQPGCCIFVAHRVTVDDDSFIVFGYDPMYWRNAADDAARRIKRWADGHYYRIKGLPPPQAAAPGGVPADVQEQMDLLTAEPVERVAAALALADMGERAAVAEPELVKRLFRDDPYFLLDHPSYPYARVTTVGAEAARALAQAGIMEPLLEGLRGSGDKTPYNVVLGLANSTYPDAEALLIEATTSDESRVRAAAVSSLGYVPRVVWKRLLQPDVRDPSVRPQHQEAIDTLIRALDDSSYRVREAAAEALAHRPAMRAMEPLISALDDRPSVRRKAVASLRMLTGEALEDDEDDWRS